MSLFEMYETNVEKEINGVDVVYPANADKSVPTFIIAHSGKSNKPYALAFEKVTKPYQRLGIEAMGEANADKAMLDLFVDHVLKGWKNIQDKEGNDIAFNRENAIMVMKKLPRLYADLQEKANSLALFKDEVKESQSGN